MDNEKNILKFVSGRNWTWIAGIILLAAGILICGLTDSILILLAIVLIFVGIYYLLRALIVDLPAIFRSKKCLNHLQVSGRLEQAAEELSAGGNSIGKDKAVFTEHFLFGHQNGAALSYSDILWVYKRRFTQRLAIFPIKTVDSLIVTTAAMREVCAVNLGRKDKKNELDAAVAQIQKQNPAVLVGYTPENKRACKEITKT